MKSEYAAEIWNFYKHGKLKPDTKLSGTFVGSTQKANVKDVMNEIEAARDDEMEKRGIKVKRP